MSKFSTPLPKQSSVCADEIRIHQSVNLSGKIAECQRDEILYRSFAVEPTHERTVINKLSAVKIDRPFIHRNKQDFDR